VDREDHAPTDARRYESSFELIMNKFIKVDQLPENPFEMPPPYWRSPGIILQLSISLEELCDLLQSLFKLHPKIEGLLFQTKFQKKMLKN
jgi:hypothetical protein